MTDALKSLIDLTQRDIDSLKKREAQTYERDELKEIAQEIKQKERELGKYLVRARRQEPGDSVTVRRDDLELLLADYGAAKFDNKFGGGEALIGPVLEEAGVGVKQIGPAVKRLAAAVGFELDKAEG